VLHAHMPLRVALLHGSPILASTPWRWRLLFARTTPFLFPPPLPCSWSDSSCSGWISIANPSSLIGRFPASLLLLVLSKPRPDAAKTRCPTLRAPILPSNWMFRSTDLVRCAPCGLDQSASRSRPLHGTHRAYRLLPPLLRPSPGSSRSRSGAASSLVPLLPVWYQTARHPPPLGSCGSALLLSFRATYP
jgi:hypothetical protein